MSESKAARASRCLPLVWLSEARPLFVWLVQRAAILPSFLLTSYLSEKETASVEHVCVECVKQQSQQGAAEIKQNTAHVTNKGRQISFGSGDALLPALRTSGPLWKPVTEEEARRGGRFTNHSETGLFVRRSVFLHFWLLVLRVKKKESRLSLDLNPGPPWQGSFFIIE